ncbi:DUF397 domain-containing protein [Streptomyces bohaiensis]|uniref:DUF397 domain-containing protein n=1 Tax=Streptomyces bohaiensis TaxID=1431344 RepID=A0ABX1CCC1_9ACTN|nr:DUF397 domain-containing protein [Streptomyces bohaiensis]NJQ15926.1 DUF397 domain-containing protein [Streptomyces bohaiensis]
MNTTSQLKPAYWVKSSYSGGNGGQCVEWAPGIASSTGTVPVRDSKIPAGPAITVPADAFAAFVAGLKSGSLPG